MAGVRFTLDLFIPEATFNAVPQAAKDDFRNKVRSMKALAVKINAGTPSEEMTIKATWHRCHHNENPPGPCEQEQEI